jgi:hypothetical protein
MVKRSIGVYKLEDIHLLQSAVASVESLPQMKRVGDWFTASATDVVKSAKINNQEYSLFFDGNKKGGFKLVEVSKRRALYWCFIILENTTTT